MLRHIYEAMNAIRDMRDAALAEVRRMQDSSNDWERTLRLLEMGKAQGYGEALDALWVVEKAAWVRNDEDGTGGDD